MATKKYDEPSYAYTAGVGKMADDDFDIKGATNSEAEMRFSDVPDQKAMRYMAEDEKLSEFLNPKAGAGRGRQGGPTAKELADYDRKMNRGIFTEGMKPPQDVDGGSAAPKKRVVKKASGGMTASKRADGIAERGKTRGKMC
jgi:hypothetical protein